MRPWVFSCKQTSQMISLSLDEQLPLSKRMGIRFHLMMCVLCRRYRKQLLAIRALLRMEQEDAGTAALSTEARQRLEKKIKEAVAKESESKR